jgi:phage terminase large subunit GpA-like protein
VPGPRDPALTPYIVAFERFFDDPRYETCVLITGTQMSKTDGVLDVMGWRLDTKPRPQLYVGPSRDFVTELFEPRLMKLFDEAATLKDLVARGKRNKKTRKTVNGVSVRLAWAGSATSLSSDQAGDVYVDEYDKMVTGVHGEGDPFTLAKARADTYADRKIAVTSTPKRGQVTIAKDKQSGLEFWKIAEAVDLESPIWAKWQTGTRHHWAWQCPHCDGWFIPRVRDLKCDKGATPAQARRKTWIACPTNGCVIEESSKAEMNSHGVFVAPGQTIGDSGALCGEPPDATILSLWVSGLASPFVTWGERLEEIMLAASGEAEARQGAVNKAGELWAPDGGDLPAWEAIKSRAAPYKSGVVPDEAIYLTIGIDVQKNRLVFVIRGWGGRATSWLIEAGELWGNTAEPQVWNDLAEKLTTPIDGVLIKLAFIDSGFRPGKKFEVPVNRVYEFARRFRSFVFATKGSSLPMITPLTKRKIEVTKQGQQDKYGLDLIRLDSGHWKSWVHERLEWPADQPGAFNLPEDVTENYCRQLIAEAKVRGPSGKPVWIERSRENHYLDAEAMAAAAGYLLNVQNLRVGARRKSSPAAAPSKHGAMQDRFTELARQLNGP